MVSSWKNKKLGELTSYISKGIPPKYVEEVSDKTIRVLNQKCNRNFKISYNESRLHDCSKKKVTDEKLLRIGDVLINSTGVGTAGRVAQLWDVTTPTTFDGHMILLRPSSEIDSMYYGYAIKSLQREIESLAEGSTGQTEINRQRLLDEIVISYPESLHEQQLIGKILYDIDEKIQINSSINDNLEKQAQALFEQRFIINGIDGDEKPLYDFADYINGAVFKPYECGDLGVPIIKIAELKNGITESTRYFDGSKDEKYYIQDKDILFSWSGNPETSIDIFIWTNGKAILNQHTFNVKSNTNHRWFTYTLLKHFKPQFKHIASNKQTTGLGHVTANDLKRLTFIFNASVIESFEQEVYPFLEMLYQNIKENHSLVQLRDSLLSKLMSGEIDVSTINI